MTIAMFALAVGSGASGTVLTRASNGFRRWGYGLGAIGAYAVATVMMALLLQRLPVGVVYAVWTGAAAVVLLVVDRLVFGVENSRIQLAGMAVTFIGIVFLATAVQS